MALSKPILLTTPAWDVTLGHSFDFNVVGGDQVVGSTLRIYDNNTNVLVYTNTVQSYALKNIVPPNPTGLENGGYYYATLTTTNVNGDVSAISNSIQFHCFSTPTFEFTPESGIPSGIIDSSTLNADIFYNQSEQELLNSYVVNLYGANDVLISTSGTQYIDSSILPITISWTFQGLSNNTQYKIEAKGLTSNGMVAETGRYSFTANYVEPIVYSNFVLTNNCENGYIVVQSNYVHIVGESDPSPAIYIDNDKIDLTDKSSWARWDDGFIVPQDFTANIWITSPNANQTLFTMRNNNYNKIVLSCVEYESNRNYIYMVLTVDDNYEIYTRPLAKNSNYVINIRCVSNIYDLIFEIV